MTLDRRGDHLDYDLVNLKLLAGQLEHQLDKLLLHRLLRACFDISIEALLFLRVQTFVDLLPALLCEQFEL